MLGPLPGANSGPGTGSAAPPSGKRPARVYGHGVASLRSIALQPKGVTPPIPRKAAGPPRSEETAGSRSAALGRAESRRCPCKAKRGRAVGFPGAGCVAAALFIATKPFGAGGVHFWNVIALSVPATHDSRKQPALVWAWDLRDCYDLYGAKEDVVHRLLGPSRTCSNWDRSDTLLSPAPCHANRPGRGADRRQCLCRDNRARRISEATTAVIPRARGRSPCARRVIGGSWRRIRYRRLQDTVI
jgi:hypothetical protein